MSTRGHLKRGECTKALLRFFDAGGRATPRELSQRLEIKVGTIYLALRRLRADGLVVPVATRAVQGHRGGAGVPQVEVVYAGQGTAIALPKPLRRDKAAPRTLVQHAVAGRTPLERAWSGAR